MDDTQVETGKESGGQLREKLEQALKDNASLRTEVLGYKASQLIAEKGYKHVTPEDLQGVDLDGIEAKAAEVEQSKAELEAQVLKRVLGDKFGDGVDVDAAINSLISGEGDGAALDRIRSVGKLQGEPVSRGAVDVSQLHGQELLRYAFSSK